MARPLLRGLCSRRHLLEPARADGHRDGQHLVHVPDDEHEPDPLQRPLRRADAVRAEPLVNSTFTLALITGLTVPDTSENAAANLAWTDIKLPKPVFVGDTLWAESEILELRESKSNPSVGIVSMRCRGINQRREVVIEFKPHVHGLQAGRDRGGAGLPRHRRRLDRLRGATMPTAAQRFAEFTGSLAYENIPGRSSRPRSSTCSTRSAAVWPPTPSASPRRAARRWRSSAAIPSRR